MDRACSSHRGDEKRTRTKVWFECLSRRKHSEEIGLGGWRVLILGDGFQGVESVHMSRDTDRWRAVLDLRNKS